MQRQLILLALHKELIKRATMTAHIIFFFMSLPESAKRHNPLQFYFPIPPPSPCQLWRHTLATLRSLAKLFAKIQHNIQE